MKDLMADEQSRVSWTDDRVAELLDSAQIHLQDKEDDRAIAIWEQMISAGGDESDWGRIEYVDYLLRRGRDDDARAQLVELLVGGRVLGHPWRLTAELLEEHGELECALFWYSAAVGRLSRESLDVPGRVWADELRAGRRRLRWAMGIPLDDEDLKAEIGTDEQWDKDRRVLWLLVEPEVVDGRLQFWTREDFRGSRHWPSGPRDQRTEGAYYRRVERVLREAGGGGRIMLVPHEYASWMRLSEVARDARRLTDVPLLISRHDDCEIIEWPPGRNRACWCGSGSKYKRCCGASAVAA